MTSDRISADAVRRILKTRFMGREIHCLETVSSSNDAARELARSGSREGTVVLTDFQTQGRGRMGRAWVSPAGKNLLLSVILRPRVRPHVVPLITLMSAVAAARTIRDWNLKAEIRWPNDVCVDGWKVAGILTEMDSGPEGRPFLVLGIGINVNMEETDFPSGLKDEASSMRLLLKKSVDRTALLGSLLLRLEESYALLGGEKHETLSRQWSEFSCLTGRWVRVDSADRRIEGVVLGIDASGELVVRLENGLVETILSGDVRLIK